jgi:pimeloyl-ACP methyl ester carboxylesterase
MRQTSSPSATIRSTVPLTTNVPSVVRLIATVLAVGSPLFAQSRPTYIQFSPGPVKGALYKPDSGPSPHVAILLIHRTANMLGAPATRELSSRGFMVLAVNPRSDNNEAAVNFEANALDIRSGVEFLRKQPGITSIVLWGHSGGGPATSFYQAVAEQGPSYCRGPNKLTECDDTLAGLPKADGLILVDAHPGISVNGLRSLNPAVVDEHDPRKLDSALDPFNPANGYKDGASRYSDEFKRKYFRAQADRMNRLIDAAQAAMKAMRSSAAPYPDDDAMVVTRFEGARLMELDPSIHHTTMKPRRLLKNDGTIVTQIVESVRRPARGYDKRNASFEGGARLMTLRSFLSANAIRAKDSLDDIDWCSSNNSTRCAVERITIPTLVTAMGAHYFIRDGEIHYEASASRDKDFIVIEGATHGFTPCNACETTPGQYSNSQKNFFDYVTKWIKARF